VVHISDIIVIVIKQPTIMKEHVQSGGGSSNAIYGLGLIGAAVYYIGAATSFWGGVLGFLKALVWPAFMVYELLKFLAL
jgi:hypothetical protein